MKNQQNAQMIYIFSIHCMNYNELKKIYIIYEFYWFFINNNIGITPNSEIINVKIGFNWLELKSKKKCSKKYLLNGREC
jgi:hypothetical protein